MRIKFYFFILVLFLLGLGGALIYLAGKMQTTHLYVVEGIIVFILLYLAVFYRKIVKPMSTIGSGMELLREQDFSSRLSRVGQYEADRIVNVFNRMMEQLKNERLRMREQNHFLDLLIQASPMGVVIMTLDGEVSQLNPMAVKMLGVRLEEAQNRKLDKIDSPLAEELASIPKETTSVVRLNDANIYKCTHFSFIDRGFKHPFFLIERMTDEVMKAEKRAYEKVIRMICPRGEQYHCRHYLYLGYGGAGAFYGRKYGRHLRGDARVYGALFLYEPFHYPLCRCGEDTRTYGSAGSTERIGIHVQAFHGGNVQ